MLFGEAEALLFDMVSLYFSVEVGPSRGRRRRDGRSAARPGGEARG